MNWQNNMVFRTHRIGSLPNCWIPHMPTCGMLFYQGDCSRFKNKLRRWINCRYSKEAASCQATSLTGWSRKTWTFGTRFWSGCRIPQIRMNTDAVEPFVVITGPALMLFYALLMLWGYCGQGRSKLEPHINFYLSHSCFYCFSFCFPVLPWFEEKCNRMNKAR